MRAQGKTKLVVFSFATRQEGLRLRRPCGLGSGRVPVGVGAWADGCLVAGEARRFLNVSVPSRSIAITLTEEGDYPYGVFSRPHGNFDVPGWESHRTCLGRGLSLLGNFLYLLGNLGGCSVAECFLLLGVVVELPCGGVGGGLGGCTGAGREVCLVGEIDGMMSVIDSNEDNLIQYILNS